MNYDKYFSDIVKNIPPSGIRKFFDVASTYKDAISLGVGEPDFDTPWCAREAGIQRRLHRQYFSVLRSSSPKSPEAQSFRRMYCSC